MSPDQHLPGIREHVYERLEKTGRSGLQVSFGQDIAGGVAVRARFLWQALGRFESLYWQEELAAIKIEAPVYICGLARAGSTILLEMLAKTGGFATHRYRDFPFIDIPVLWNRWLDVQPRTEVRPEERAHLDGMRVTFESPESMEEMIWMPFFPECHSPAISAVLARSTKNPVFERYYRDHVRKILWLRDGARYLSKNNYNLTRMGYLRELFPDAKFIVPVRDPVMHIASLMKQHSLMSLLEKRSPRILRYMQRSGHFEFGLDRRPVNTGSMEETERIAVAWAEGDEIGGWALYWNMMHGWLLTALQKDTSLRESVCIVPYDDLCTRPDAWLRRIGEFCGAGASGGAGVHAPAYYKHDFDEATLRRISSLTEDTWRGIKNIVT